MSDFDPNHDPATQDEADEYINWCAENYARLSQGPERTYRSGIRCAAWLFVVSTAPMHLAEEVEEHRDAMLTQLASYNALARAIERQRQHYVVERLIVLRSSLDCWEATGEWGGNLLDAAKCAVMALLMIELHPLIDLWELSCPDVWALLDAAGQSLADINMATELTFEDFGVIPAQNAIAKYTWQKANNLVRHIGMPPLSAN